MYQVLGYKGSGSQDTLFSGGYSDCINWMGRQCDADLYQQGYRRWELKTICRKVVLTDEQVESYWWRK